MQQEYTSEEITIDLLKIVKAFWKKLWLILLVGILLGGAMFFYGKITYVPQYQTTATMYARLSSQDAASSASMDKLTGTCIAVLKTRMTLEEIAASSGLDISYSNISSMISASGIPNSTLFNIAVSGTDPDDITQIANTAADVLPGMVYSVYGECEVGVVDYALVPATPSNGSGVMKNTLIASCRRAIAMPFLL